MIVTNAHVVEDCVSIDVNGFGSAKRIAVDESSDLAVIRLTGAPRYRPGANPIGAASPWTGRSCAWLSAV